MANLEFLWTLYWVWLVVANVTSVIMFRHDKAQAQRPGVRRVPEARLLLLLAAGGVVGGALAMFMRPRHKTRKPRFWLVLIAASVGHAFIALQGINWG